MSSRKEIEYKINSDGCWIVTSHRPNGNGYCAVLRNGVRKDIHRLMYEERFGNIPEGNVVRHKCDNTLCCNPDHLETGTHADNVRDRVSRGRSASGTNNGRAKLTEEDVRVIKYESPLGNTHLARMFGVDPKTVRDIKQGKIWKHV